MLSHNTPATPPSTKRHFYAYCCSSRTPTSSVRPLLRSGKPSSILKRNAYCRFLGLPPAPGSVVAQFSPPGSSQVRPLIDFRDVLFDPRSALVLFFAPGLMSVLAALSNPGSVLVLLTPASFLVQAAPFGPGSLLMLPVAPGSVLTLAAPSIP